MKSTRRAVRRHHRDRLLKNRRKKINWVTDETYTGIVINTPCPCSCGMCGNPRKLHSITDQEALAELKLVEGAEEAGVYISERRNNIGKRGQW